MTILARACGIEVELDDVPVSSLVPDALESWAPADGEVLADAFIQQMAVRCHHAPAIEPCLALPCGLLEASRDAAQASSASMLCGQAFALAMLLPLPLLLTLHPPGPERTQAFDDEKADLIAKADANGEVLRFVGVVDVASGKCSVELKPYPKTHPFAGTQFADNICAFSTERYAPQPLVVQGPGAGAAVTAAGIYADFLRVAKSC